MNKKKTGKRAAKTKATPLVYSEVINTRGVDIPFVPEIITPPIERPMRNDRYEAGECAMLEGLVQPEDRVLDLGAGVGLVSSIASRLAHKGHVTAIEANPRQLPLIEETYRLNGIENVTLINAIVSPKGQSGSAPFYLRKDFWASSMEPDSRSFEEKVKVKRIDIAQLMQDVQPDIICCDIEGGELDLFDGVDLSGVRAIVMEFHPKVYGLAGEARLRHVIQSGGLRENRIKHRSSVHVFQRPEEAAYIKRSNPGRRPQPMPPEPRILLATCMKDEGPFVLEWLAWHKAMGVTDFVIFTNDCTDGTDLLLDRLHERGDVLHLPNPALAKGRADFQPVALSYIQHFSQFRQADYFISSDVDEFFNVRVGEGRFVDLFASVEPFDVLSANEINHGSNSHEDFTPGWVTELFPKHQTETPGKQRANAGVKSITRLGPRIEAVRNHRPDLKEGIKKPVWLDGSGQRHDDFLEDEGANGCDCRGRYDLVSLEHYPLRSLGSYLAKMSRGDVVVPGKQVSQRYWRTRNRNSDHSVDLSRGIERTRAWYDENFAGDEILMGLHEECNKAHAALIGKLLRMEAYLERVAWIKDEAWD